MDRGRRVFQTRRLFHFESSSTSAILGCGVNAEREESLLDSSKRIYVERIDARHANRRRFTRAARRSRAPEIAERFNILRLVQLAVLNRGVS